MGYINNYINVFEQNIQCSKGYHILNTRTVWIVSLADPTS